MKVLINNSDNFNIDLINTNDNKLGWNDNIIEFENKTIQEIINPIENYEIVRYIHEPYRSSNNITQTDLWIYFYFIDNNGDYMKGLDYSTIGISAADNIQMTKRNRVSFFRLDFFKTPNTELPQRTNRKSVFSRNLSIPQGEQIFFSPVNKKLYVPVFTGSNYRNKENMYHYWFEDDSVLNDTLYNNNIFWFSSRFFNTKSGEIIDFTNKPLSTDIINESNDLYFKMVIEKNNFTYKMFDLNGNRIGTPDNPIKFYQKR